MMKSDIKARFDARLKMNGSGAQYKQFLKEFGELRAKHGITQNSHVTVTLTHFDGIMG